MIKIYNSLTGEKEPFEPGSVVNQAGDATGQAGELVTMYVCGPTVYDHAHLGHGRSAVAFDIVRRFLEFSGYTVDFAFNVTDIDDKMIKRANEEKITVADLAKRIIPEYDTDYAALGIKAPSHNPRATDYIEQMISLVRKLEDKGCTYRLEDGIYFDIKKFPQYGKLSHQKMEELEAGARIAERTDKRNHQDFVLWKFKKEDEPFWSSPWGDGRPGWHIECSAMSHALFGKTIDIHGGGLDLKFPHHECEIAQSESAHGQEFARYWMHNGYITINQEKMSKSLDNFFLLKEIFEKYHPRIVRFFLLSTHYRSPIEYNEEQLQQARNTLRGLDESYLRKTSTQNPSDSLTEALTKADETLIAEISQKMSNDFDTAGAIAALFKGIDQASLAGLNKIDEIFNIFPTDFQVTEEQTALLKERETARQEKDWAKSDQIRDKLAEEGIEVEDGKDGSFLRPRI